MNIGHNLTSFNSNFKFSATEANAQRENKSLTINSNNLIKNSSISKEMAFLEEQITKIKESNLLPEEKQNKIQEIESRLLEIKEQEAKKQLEEQKKLIEKAGEEMKSKNNTEEEGTSDVFKSITSTFQDLDLCSRLRQLQSLHPDRKERIQKYINETINGINDKTSKINTYIKNSKTEKVDSSRSSSEDNNTSVKNSEGVKDKETVS